MKDTVRKWGFFLLLCMIWGSSFILMKLGMYAAPNVPALTAVQVAAIRILSAGLVLLPFAINAFRRIPRALIGHLAVAGLLGSFLPAFLFCIAETKIDSALTAMINSATPIFAILCAAVVFKKVIPQNQVWGVVIGFAGCISLFYSKRSESAQNLLYAGLVILATICYGINVNFVKQKLSQLNARDITAASFAIFVLPSAAILYGSGYFHLPLLEPVYVKATIASAVLGIVGTAFATIIFYSLVKMVSPVFASLVTYGIPLVAIGWGLLYGEEIGISQVIALVIILCGVYIASLSKTAVKPPTPTSTELQVANDSLTQ